MTEGDEELPTAPAEFASAVADRTVDTAGDIDDDVVTTAMARVYLDRAFPGHEAGAVADRMRELIDVADLRIGAFGECATAAAERIGEETDETPTADAVIEKVFDVTIEDVSDALNDPGELVEALQTELADRDIAPERDRDRRDGPER